MRRSVLILMTVAALLALSAGAALAAVIQCQGGLCEGTPDPDTMTGTAGYDNMYGRGGADEMRARDGNDVLIGNEGSDKLLAGAAGDDYLKGGAGNDTLDGGGGSDVYRLENGWGEDTIAADSEGTGDRISFNDMTFSLTVDLSSPNNVKAYSGVNKVKWPSTVAIEDVGGGENSDIIKGNAANNFLFGNFGNDKLWGNGGSDTLVGDDGYDTIYAQWDGGADRISCGEGYDIVHYDRYTDTLLDSENCEDKRPYIKGTVVFPS